MAEKSKIVVVDDEEVITGATRKILGTEQWDVRIAATAEKALELLQLEIPDIMFVDLMLPGLSGMELLARIAVEYSQTAVIMMTGYSTLANATAFLRGGAFDFLPKPFTFEELISTARRACRFLSLPANERLQGLADYPFLLGIGSWAMVDHDGTALLGITRLFEQIVGGVEQVESPPAAGELRQGGMLAQIVARDELKHPVWSALSGRVIEINPGVQGKRSSQSHDPMSNWLARIMPEDLDRELLNLSAGRPPRG